MGLIKKQPFDKDVILYVGRKDKVVAYITKARRVRDPVKGLYFQMKAPAGSKIIYDVGDIPTENFSSSGVIELYTPDFEQFVPCTKKFNTKKELEIIFLSNVQKEWYSKSVREDYLKTMKKTWWSENKTLILTALVLLTLIILSYVLMNGIMDAGNLMKEIIIQNYGLPLPVDMSNIPPVWGILNG